MVWPSRKDDLQKLLDAGIVCAVPELSTSTYETDAGAPLEAISGKGRTALACAAAAWLQFATARGRGAAVSSACRIA